MYDLLTMLSQEIIPVSIAASSSAEEAGSIESAGLAFNVPESSPAKRSALFDNVSESRFIPSKVCFQISGHGIFLTQILLHAWLLSQEQALCEIQFYGGLKLHGYILHLTRQPKRQVLSRFRPHNALAIKLLWTDGPAEAGCLEISCSSFILNQIQI